MPPDPRLRKLRRVSRACDFCHNRSSRCQQSSEDTSRCQKCTDFDLQCTYTRPVQKRGLKPKRSSGPSAISHLTLGLPDLADDEEQETGEARRHSNLDSASFQRHDGVHLAVESDSPSHSASSHWRAESMPDQETIGALVEIYFDIVYPIFPFFHRPSLRRRITNREYLTNQGLLACVMVICALASARVRDGAASSSAELPGTQNYWSSEDFYAAAQSAVPKDLSNARGIDYMRTFALLALSSIQSGRIDAMQLNMGIYHALVSVERLYDESAWPKGTGLVEIEERRRLFWSMYTLDVYSTIVWGGIIHWREAQARVSYPSEIEDEWFSDAGIHISTTIAPQVSNDLPSLVSRLNGSSSSWLRGWNFTTDLYRILEHVMDQYHRLKGRSASPPTVTDLFTSDNPSQAKILDHVMALYNQLPQRFKETPEVEADASEDRFNFQAANITATLQLVRMVLFTTGHSSVEQKCFLAGELLANIATVPVRYLRAISSPLLHHLAGIGSVLGSAIEGRLTEPSYLQIRAVLLDMADLLANLEVGLSHSTGTSDRLRSIIFGIDRYMQTECQPQKVSDNSSQQFVSGYGDYSANSVLQGQQSVPETDPGHIQGGNVHFELPMELLADWPWSSEFNQFAM